MAGCVGGGLARRGGLVVRLLRRERHPLRRAQPAQILRAQLHQAVAQVDGPLRAIDSEQRRLPVSSKASTTTRTRA